MPKKISYHCLATLLVAASLSLMPAAAQARSADRHREQRAAFSLRDPSASLLGALWSSLTSVWGKEGTSIDPNGAPAPSGAGSGQTPSDTGGSIDPDGLRGDSATTTGSNG
jgi:hypothetical protein